jgi:diguanylate cyclase (GGDEF)-like protein
LSDTVVSAIWGGDEFTVYIYEDKEEIKHIIDTIFKQINGEPQLKEYQITISLGLTSSQKIDTVDTMLLRADKALYEAKEKGRNRYIISYEAWEKLKK